MRWSVPREKARKLLGVQETQLRSWERQRLIPVSDVYSFTELSALRTLMELRRQGVHPTRIRLTVTAAREKLRGADPLTQARVFLHANGRIGVKADGRTLDPTRDQYLFDFDLDPVPSAVHALPQRVDPPDTPRRRDHEADKWFQRGLQAEQTGQGEKAAEEAYRRCLEVDPKHASALVNLGTLFFNRRKIAEAERCYRRAVDADPHYALAHFNLANLHDERGDIATARQHYEMALELNPKYADAHYNLALMLQGQGEALRAISHWRTYLKLDPSSSWSAIARRELERMKTLTVLPGGGAS